VNLLRIVADQYSNHFQLWVERGINPPLSLFLTNMLLSPSLPLKTDEFR